MWVRGVTTPENSRAQATAGVLFSELLSANFPAQEKRNLEIPGNKRPLLSLGARIGCQITSASKTKVSPDDFWKSLML